MTILTYKNYQASVSFESGRIVIHVLHVDDHLVAECTDSTKVEEVFHELVDDYLADCADVGKDPDKPYKGLFNVRISPDLHRTAAKVASLTGLTLNELVGRALEAYVSPDIAQTEWVGAVYTASTIEVHPRTRERIVDDNPEAVTSRAELLAWTSLERH